MFPFLYWVLSFCVFSTKSHFLILLFQLPPLVYPFTGLFFYIISNTDFAFKVLHGLFLPFHISFCNKRLALTSDWGMMPAPHHLFSFLIASLAFSHAADLIWEKPPENIHKAILLFSFKFFFETHLFHDTKSGRIDAAGVLSPFPLPLCPTPHTMCAALCCFHFLNL